VVSAGAKAILDLPRTVEVLETLGVLVIGYRTAEFPAFYTGRSGVPLDHRVDTAAELAAIARARWDELEAGGILICNPIPEAAALDATSIDIAIATALAEATAGADLGQAAHAVLAVPAGAGDRRRSIRANRALALHNAEVASALARARVVTPHTARVQAASRRPVSRQPIQPHCLRGSPTPCAG
jgi:pseudouridine-5'-phosphate glycosidase